MTHSAIRLLILHKQLSFSLKIKHTLEQIGGFAVSTFTTLETAADYLQNNPQHVAWIDFTLPGTTGLDIVLKFRSIQPQITIVASPDLPEVAAVVHQMNLAGMIDAPISARDLIPALREILRGNQALLPDTAEAFIMGADSETMPVNDDNLMIRTNRDESESARTLDAKTIEFVLRADIEREKELPEGLTKDSVYLFQHLAAEEPPIPSPLEGAGTVHDLRDRLHQADLQIVSGGMEEGASSAFVATPEHPEDTPAEIALRVVSDESVTLESLKNALQSEFPDTQGIQPLQSWAEHQKRYVDEPDFLEAMPKNPLDGYHDDLIDAAKKARPDDSHNDMETEVMPRSASPPSMPPPPPADLPGEKPKAALPPYEFAKEPETSADSHLSEPDTEGVIRELAVSLTRASLESTAEVVVLARDGEIVDFSGALPRQEIEAISEMVAGDWDAKPGEARVRFITLPSSGQDYMIHSRRTQDDFTLSLIFAGNMPLRVMRAQSDKLLRALMAVPELPAPTRDLRDEIQERELQKLEAEAAQEVEAAVEATAEIAREHGEEYTRDLMKSATEGTTPRLSEHLASYTFLWMTRNPEGALAGHVARLLARELESQLTELGWMVENVQVYEDYIYLLADVADDSPSNVIIADLKQRSAWIAHQISASIDPETLWADGYCVLAPGREMDSGEIQRYINFARM